MDKLQEEQILQSYKETIIKMFAVSEKRATILARKHFNIILSLGGVPTSDQAIANESIKHIVGSWIELNVAADADNE